MNKEIQEIRRRAGITEEQVFTTKDAGFLAHKIKEIQSQHRDWKSLSDAIVKFIMQQLENAYEEGYNDGNYGTKNVNEIIGKASPEDIQRMRKRWGVPEHYTPAQAMMFINQKQREEKSYG